MGNERRAQTSDVEGSRIISGAVPAAGVTDEPRSPVFHLREMLRGTVGMSGSTATGTGMRSLAWLLPFQAYSNQMAFVAQNAPYFTSHLRIVSPISPFALRIASASCRFQGLEGLPCNEAAPRDRCQ